MLLALLLLLPSFLHFYGSTNSVSSTVRQDATRCKDYKMDHYSHVLFETNMLSAIKTREKLQKSKYAGNHVKALGEQ